MSLFACPVCKQEKLLEEFLRKPGSWRRSFQCSSCRRQKATATAKAWRDKNPTWARDWARKNKETRGPKHKLWRENNRELCRQQTKDWRSRNKGHRATYMRNKRACDPQEKIAGASRSRIADALRHRGLTKNERTLTLIGCSTKELCAHLESKFTAGMEWGNYGQWHVDHIRPCSAFDLSVLAQRLECFNWKNLQPLWAADNYRKGGIRRAA